MSKRTIIIALALLLALAGGYYAYTNYTQSTSASTTTTTQVATVTRGNLIATVAGAGQVSAKSQVALNFGSSGVVQEVYVKVGDAVKQGQVLAELDASDLQFTLASAQLAYNQQVVRYEQTKTGATADELAVAHLQVEVAQANYEAAVKKANLTDEQRVVARVSLDKAALSLQKAQSDYDKATANRQTDLTAQAVALQQAKLDYAAAQANYNLQLANLNDTSVRSAAASLLSAKANLLKLQNSPTAQELQIAEAQLEQAQLTLQQAQYKLRDMQLIAPIDGIVTQVNVDRFSVVGATIQAMQIADLNQLRITVNLSEVDIAKVKVGQAVNISFDAIAELPQLTGTVEQIALVGTTTQGVVNYPVVVALPAMEANLVKTGMTANVAIVVDKRENVLLVPNRAVKTQNRQKVVQLQTATGTAQTVIQLGLQNDSQSEVLSGLKEGDKVIIQTTTTSSTQNRNAGSPPPFGP